MKKKVWGYVQMAFGIIFFLTFVIASVLGVNPNALLFIAGFLALGSGLYEIFKKPNYQKEKEKINGR